MNRNFLVRSDAREMLESSNIGIYWSFIVGKVDLFGLQREGRTKDGNDATNPGVLKMVGMASNGMDLMDYFKHQSSPSFNFL
jgi:hypothetical protein